MHFLGNVIGHSPNFREVLAPFHDDMRQAFGPKPTVATNLDLDEKDVDEQIQDRDDGNGSGPEDSDESEESEDESNWYDRDLDSSDDDSY